MTKIHRICLYGGPNSGKSRLAARLYGDPSLSSYRLELVREFVKEWAYTSKSPTNLDQVLIFSEQKRLEEILLTNVENVSIITDSPLYLQTVYAKIYFPEMFEPLFECAKNFEKQYPSVNILLDRGNIKYDQCGRYQDEKQAKVIDNKIKDFLEDNKIPYWECFTTDYTSILQYVKYQLDKE